MGNDFSNLLEAPSGDMKYAPGPMPPPDPVPMRRYAGAGAALGGGLGLAGGALASMLTEGEDKQWTRNLLIGALLGGGVGGLGGALHGQNVALGRQNEYLNTYMKGSDKELGKQIQATRAALFSEHMRSLMDSLTQNFVKETLQRMEAQQQSNTIPNYLLRPQSQE